MAAIQYTLDFLCLVRLHASCSFTIFCSLALRVLEYTRVSMCIHLWICRVSLLGANNRMWIPFGIEMMRRDTH